MLVTLGALGSLHFGANWTGEGGKAAESDATKFGANSTGEGAKSACSDETKFGAKKGANAARGGGLLAHETRMGCFDIVGGKPTDTTGAGDCFRGSYVAARYGEGRSVEQVRIRV